MLLMLETLATTLIAKISLEHSLKITILKFVILQLEKIGGAFTTLHRTAMATM